MPSQWKCIVPVPYYSLPNDTPAQQGNRIGVVTSSTVSTIGAQYPISYDRKNLLSAQSPYLHASTELGITSTVSNGLYRQAGQTNPQDVYFDPRHAVFTNHDDTFQLKITDDHTNVITATTDYTTGWFQPYGDPTDSSTDMFDKQGQDVLRIDQSAWASAGYTQQQLPLNTYVVMLCQDEELHIMTQGLLSLDPSAYLIRIACVNVHTSQNNRLELGTAAAAFMGVPEIRANAVRKTFNGSTGPITFKYSPDARYDNTRLTCVWGDMTGSCGMTAPMNYMGEHDVNNPDVLAQEHSNILKQSKALLASYNKGGHYFLTHFRGLLTVQTGDNAYPMNISTIISTKVSILGFFHNCIVKTIPGVANMLRQHPSTIRPLFPISPTSMPTSHCYPGATTENHGHRQSFLHCHGYIWHMNPRQ